MIAVDRINYTTQRDHSVKEPVFVCTASVPVEVPDGAAPKTVSVTVKASIKDTAQDAAQLAILRELIGQSSKKAPAAPVKETP